MQNEGQSYNLYQVLKNHIPAATVLKKNKTQSWNYGYNEEYDIVVISKTGMIGDIISIRGLNIALPDTPEKCLQRHKDKEEQYWERQELPRELSKIQSIFQWNEKPKEFKDRWVEYIEQQFDYREQGFWFMNNGKPTYITGSHYMYLQWSVLTLDTLTSVKPTVSIGYFGKPVVRTQEHLV